MDRIETQSKGGEAPSTKFLICAAIGSGNTALAAERGGADMLLAINAGRLRNMGAPSIACMLPIFDASPLTEDFAREELLAQCRIPVLLGVNVWGQDFKPREKARAILDAGFAGAVNFPSCMHYSRPMQQILSRAGRGIEREVEQLRAVQDVGLTSMFYCATRTQARLAADAGIDLVCLNLGWNVGGALGHRRRASLEEVATAAREIGRLIKRINPKTRLLLEGGPIATAEDLGRIISLAPIDGYVGGSTFERMPLEASVADQIDAFRHASSRRAALDRESARLVTWSRKFGFVGRAKPHINFLRRLRALSETESPVLVLAEKGVPTAPVLDAFSATLGRDSGQAAVRVDVVGSDFPTRAQTILFGQRETVASRPPALGSTAIDLLAIDVPECIPSATQRRLARALRDGDFRVPGTSKRFAVGPRVVLLCRLSVPEGQEEHALTAAGVDPELASQMAGWILRVPPLRERIEDLMAIAETLSGHSLGMAVDRAFFSSAALQRLHAHLWPGNEAELRGVLGALTGRAAAKPVQPEELRPLLQGDAPETASDTRTEKDRIVDALWRHGYKRTPTAEALGMSRKTLYNKIKKYGLYG